MDISKLQRRSEFEWVAPPQGRMRVPAVIYASAELVAAMDEKVYQQVTQVAMLPGIVQASYAMPDAHWGYGFPIGGVAAFDADTGGVVSAGGVGFDISCGVRTLHTDLKRANLEAVKTRLADALYARIPAGVGSTGQLQLLPPEMDAMLCGGAQWALKRGYGETADLDRTEEHGCMAGADPAQVSEHAKRRQRDEMGTLGSGNHYLEVQQVTKIFYRRIAAAFDLRKDDILVSIHCGSRGLGHQIGTEYLKEMLLGARDAGIDLPDRELACAPLNSPLGQRYLGAMRAATNCALANRQILTHLTREVFHEILPDSRLTLLYDGKGKGVPAMSAQSANRSQGYPPARTGNRPLRPVAIDSTAIAANRRPSRRLATLSPAVPIRRPMGTAKHSISQTRPQTAPMITITSVS